MAKNHLAKLNDAKSDIVIQVFDETANARDGMEGLAPSVRMIKHNYQGRMFDYGDERLLTIPCQIVKLRGNIRRNYESTFDPENPSPPTCYSYDGVNGSREAEKRIYGGRERTVYGTCKNCYFSQFGTAGVWSGQAPRKGVQCSEYALAFLILENGEAAILQVPPTGVRSLRDSIDGFLRKIPGGTMHNLIWELLPSGGGKSKKYIAAEVIRGATAEEYSHVKAEESDLNTWIMDFVMRFASGGANDEDGAEDNIPSSDDTI